MKRVSLLLLLIAMLVAVGVLAIFPKWTVDDAYISYRYGVNLVETGQLTYNIGEKPVEGYTGITLPLMAAAAHQLGIGIELTVKVLMLLAWLGVMLLMWKIGNRLKINSVVISASILLWVLNPILYTHLFSGLETLLFSFLMLLLIWIKILVINQKEASISSLFAMGLAGFLLLLTRPEGMVLVPWVMVMTLAARRAVWARWDFKSALILLIVYGLPSLGYTLWRIQYFGDWLPNTWYAKRFEGTFNPEAILEMGYTFAVTVGPMLLWLAAGRILFKPLRPKASEDRLKVFTSFTALCIPVLMAVGYSRSHLFMNYSHRFFAPTLSVLLVPMMVEGDRILKKLQMKDSKSFIQNGMKFGLILLALAQLSVFIIKLKLEFTWTSYYQRVMTQLYIPVADSLKAELPPNAQVALYMDAGMIAYRSQLTCIDFGKLNDPVLAHGNRDSAFVTDYFFGKMPDAAVFTSLQYDNYDYIPEAHQIQSDSRFENYQLFRKFKTDLNDPYFQFIYLKKAR